MKKIFNLAALLGTVVVFLVMFLLQKVAVNFDFLNIFEQTLSDFKTSDLYFTQLRDNDAVEVDSNVVIVNIGYLPRAGLGAQIEIISRYRPKAIGLDALLGENKSFEQDSAFTTSLMLASERTNVVLASKLEKPNLKKLGFDSLGLPIAPFRPYIQTGFVNVITDGSSSYETARIVSIKERIADSVEYSFATKLVQLSYPEKAKKLLARNTEIETINYRGNWDKFLVIDPIEVLEEKFEPHFFKDKIVIMGYMGEHYYLDDGIDDIYYTPMNSRPVGRTTTDMYGIMIHANMISMMLHENYLDIIPNYLSLIFAVLICYFNVAFFSYIYFHKKLGSWYDVITKGIQIGQIVLFLFVFIWSFSTFHVVLEATVAVVAIVLSGDVLELFLAFLSRFFPKTLQSLH